MARKPLTKPRKYASQERSRATVDALVEATARILVHEGFGKASTNRIANLAGVSVPRVGPLEKLETFNTENYALFKSYLEKHCDEIRVGDLDLAAFVCVTTIEALTHNAVLRPAKVTQDATIDTLVDEATRLVVGYLKADFRDPTESKSKSIKAAGGP
jgi:tetracycline repressor-like protein